MNHKSAIFVGLLIALAAALAIAAQLLNHPWLTYIFKPLATVLILALALANAAKTKLPFARWISLGIFLSLFGDILLLRPDKWFLPGLAVFLLSHIAYFAAFTRDVKFPANATIWLAFLAIAAANFFALRPHLPRGLEPPVAINAFALATMTAQAIGRALLLRTITAKLAAAGAVFFLLSDSLLAWDRFRHPLPFAPLLILAPYYLAQCLIASSTSE